MRAVAVWIGFTSLLHAQSRPAPASFDVASVKVSQASGRESRRERIEAVPGSLIMVNVRFVTAVRWAYHVFDYQVSGPSWTGEQRYDIVAKAATPAPELELRGMLRTLLAERFQLAIHRQTKEMQAYVAVIGKGGHKMTPSTTEGPMSVKPVGLSVVVERADLDEVAALLAQPLQAPVINATGLTGKFDFKADMAPYITPEVTNAKSPLDLIGVGITALQEQLGIKIESKKVPVDLIVIDRAERTPVEN